MAGMATPHLKLVCPMIRKLMTGLSAGIIVALTLPSAAEPVSLVTDATGGSLQTSTEPMVEAAAPPPDRLQNLLIHAISMIGVNYKYGGNSAQSGFDCSGFVRHVFAESLALELPRSSYAMGKLGVSVKSEDLQPGDLVFYKTLNRAFSHVGIYLGEGRFVHAPSRGKRVEIVNMSDGYWKKRFNGARRLLGE